MTVFVILHYQALKETLDCVRSIKNNIAKDYKIIIVDNLSPNNSGEQLKKQFSQDNRIVVVVDRENCGFAKGNNIGYQEAKRYDPDYIVVLNSDTVLLQSNFLVLVEEAYKKYKFDVLGPDIYSTKANYHQNPQRHTNYTLRELKRQYRKLTFKDRYKWILRIKYFIFRTHRYNNSRYTRAEEIQTDVVLHGAFYIFSHQFIEKHNECFYSNTFMYYESYILHHMGMREKMRFLYYPAIKVNHLEDASTDNTYKTVYNKSIFVNKCLMESCKEFIRIYEKKEIRLG